MRNYLVTRFFKASKLSDELLGITEVVVRVARCLAVWIDWRLGTGSDGTVCQIIPKKKRKWAYVWCV